MPGVIAALLAAAITSGAWWMSRPAKPATLVTRFAITLPQGQTFTGIARRVIDVSKDGTQFVYPANRRLYRRTLGELDAMPIPGSEFPTGVASPVFSPDGRWIAFLAIGAGGASIQRIPSAGGTPEIVAKVVANPFGLSWSAEGILIGGGQQGILRVSPNGGMTPEQVVAAKPGEVASYPQMLPGGDAVLFTRRGRDSMSDASEIVVHSLSSGKDTVVVMSGADARYVNTGHLLYGAGGVVFAVPFDVKRMATVGDPVIVINGVARAGQLGATGGLQFSVSDNGALAYVPGPAVTAQAQYDLALIDRAGRIEQLMLPPGAYEAPRVSPDGKRIAVSTSRDKEADILIYDLSGASAPRPLTLGGRNRFPIWSGDGQRVAFQSDREGDPAIFVTRMDGVGEADRLTTPAKGASHVPDSWSPDGEHLLFSETKDAEVSSWVVSLKDKQVSLFGDIHSLLPIDAVFSPSGTWVTYQQGRPGDNGVYVRPFPTGTPYKVSTGPAAHHPAWSGNKEIVYLPAQATAVVASVNLQPSFSVGKATVELPVKGLENGPASIRSYDVMPDGRLLGIVNAEPQPSGVSEAPQIRVVLNWFEELKQKAPTEH